MGEKKVCFVIAPIGEDGSPTRNRSDQILEFIIKPAAEECGYEAKRADSFPTPGMITKQIIDQLIDAALVIADLTEYNPNVFYELAVRHAVKKPFVHIIDRDSKIPFDIGPMRAVRVTHQDLAQGKRAKEDLVQAIRAAETEPEGLENPISTTVELRGLQRSGTSVEKMLGEILETVQRIASRVEAKVDPETVASTVQAFLSRTWNIPVETRGFEKLRAAPRHIERGPLPATDVSGGPKAG